MSISDHYGPAQQHGRHQLPGPAHVAECHHPSGDSQFLGTLGPVI